MASLDEELTHYLHKSKENINKLVKCRTQRRSLEKLFDALQQETDVIEEEQAHINRHLEYLRKEILSATVSEPDPK